MLRSNLDTETVSLILSQVSWAGLAGSQRYNDEALKLASGETPHAAWSSGPDFVVSAEVTEEALSEDAAEPRGDSKEVEKNGEDADGARPQAALEPEQESRVEDAQAPGEEKEAINTHSPTRLPSQKHPDPQAEGDSDSPSQGLVDREKGLGAERGQQAKREEEEEEDGEKADAEEEGPAAAVNPHPSLSYKIRKGESTYDV